jgi:transcription elongation factor GreA
MVLQKIPMTKSGEMSLREELHTLIEARPALARAISEAREHGDLKENAEYHAAKDKQGLSEARIAFIQDRLKNAQVIDVTKIGKRDTVVFGATVTIYNEAEERTIRAQIVGEEEANLGAQKISITSPIARACIGKMVGDEIEVHTPGGEQSYEIVSIEYL